MIKGDRRRNDNNAWVFTLRRVQTEVANSACDQEPDVAVAQMILANGFEYRFRVKLSVDVDFRVLNAGGRAGPTFNRRFCYCLSSGLVSFRFVYHQRVTGFHIKKKSRCFIPQFKRRISERQILKASNSVSTLLQYTVFNV